jgi:hypothetical protein
VRRARRREADPANLRRIAAEAFNRSPYANEIRQAGRTLGQPQCGIVIEGIGLPRRLRLVFAWEHTLRELLVEVDLVERSLDVAPAGRSDDAGRASFPQNAAWTPANGLIADP